MQRANASVARVNNATTFAATILAKLASNGGRSCGINDTCSCPYACHAEAQAQVSRGASETHAQARAESEGTAEVTLSIARHAGVIEIAGVLLQVMYIKI